MASTDLGFSKLPGLLMNTKCLHVEDPPRDQNRTDSDCTTARVYCICLDKHRSTWRAGRKGRMRCRCRPASEHWNIAHL